MELVKAHAYGNDFLLAEEQDTLSDADGVARQVCDRHRGVGADGLILYRHTPQGASMRLLNADGSYSEISGNGIRCLAALLASRSPGQHRFLIETDAGVKTLDLMDRNGAELTFRAAMGEPAQLRQLTLTGEETCRVVALRVGNPQCVMLVPKGELTEVNLHRYGPFLTKHPEFAAGTNVELASVENRSLVNILIWERGVGPTEASGTGACAAAVAAAAYGGASRDVQIRSPGGTQRVEWLEDGLYLTGAAAVICRVAYEGL
jgi:diaminopimelate epimerase